MKSLAYDTGYMDGVMCYHSGNKYPIGSEEHEQYSAGWNDGYDTHTEEGEE